VTFELWRDGGEARLHVPLHAPPDPFVYRTLYDERPQYLVVGGLVFSPLTKNYLRSRAGRPEAGIPQQLRYYAQYAKLDGLHEGKTEFVVLTRRLPHPLNAYMDDFVEGILEEVNGRAIGNLSDVRAAFALPRDGYHVLRFAGMDDLLVLHAETTERADPQIFDTYGIADPEYIKETPR